MTAELRDFARSILRMDGERVMWFERSQELAKKCDALTAEVDEARARRLAGPFSLINAELGASEDESSIEACKRVVAERDEARAEVNASSMARVALEAVRDAAGACDDEFVTDAVRRRVSEGAAARAELAGVAAQRDAHLARSVELATRVAELETQLAQARAFGDQVCTERDQVCTERDELAARLAALALDEARDWLSRGAPAPVEVDGFRAGDLVRHRSPVLSWGVVDSASGCVRVVYPGHDRGPGVSSYKPDELTRKPVEVGDTVRIVEGGHTGCVGRVDGIIGGEARVVTDPNASLAESLWVTLPRLVAVAP